MPPRKNLDQYFTPEAYATRFVESVVSRYDPRHGRQYVEPSAGQGVFVRALRAAQIPENQITSIDIDPAMPTDIHADFLTWKPKSGDWIVIGNPPFGVQGKTARAFVEHALEFAAVCCFVVPRSMTRKGRKPNVTLGVFDENGEETPIPFEDTGVRCVWAEYFPAIGGVGQVMPPKAPDPPLRGIKLVGKDDPYDVVIQRAGSRLGHVTTCNGTGQGKYYIKAENEAMLKAVRSIWKYLTAIPEAKETALQHTLSHGTLQRVVQHAYFAENYSAESN